MQSDERSKKAPSLAEQREGMLGWLNPLLRNSLIVTFSFLLVMFNLLLLGMWDPGADIPNTIAGMMGNIVGGITLLLVMFATSTTRGKSSG